MYKYAGRLCISKQWHGLKSTTEGSSSGTWNHFRAVPVVILVKSKIVVEKVNKQICRCTKDVLVLWTVLVLCRTAEVSQLFPTKKQTMLLKLHPTVPLVSPGTVWGSWRCGFHPGCPLPMQKELGNQTELKVTLRWPYMICSPVSSLGQGIPWDTNGCDATSKQHFPHF